MSSKTEHVANLDKRLPRGRECLGERHTGRIVKEIESETFSIAEFWARRVRRITPAAFVCVFIVMVVASRVMQEAQLVATISACRASILSVANLWFAFWVPSGYFDVSNELNPVLHLWSLGVEEQFYFIWPSCMVILARVRPNYRIFCCVICIAFCAAAGYLLQASHPMVAYYTLVTRLGELVVGALLVLVNPSHFFKNHRVASEVSGAVGLGSIFLCGWLLDSTWTFPGFVCLVPCFGAALCICGGFNNFTLVHWILSRAPFRMLGAISYSVYLYHWPIFSFLRYLAADLSGIHGLSAIVWCLAISMVSYVAIEQPFRRVTWPPGRVLLLLFVLPSAVLLAASTVPLMQQQLYHSPDSLSSTRLSGLYGGNFSLSQIGNMRDPWIKWGRPELWNIDVFGTGAVVDWNSPLRIPFQALCTVRTPQVCMDMCPQLIGGGAGSAVGCPCIRRDEQCWIGTPPNPNRKPMLLIGDSNAAAYVGALEEFARAGGFRILNILQPGSQPWIFNYYWASAYKRLSEVEVVILASQWASFLHLKESQKELIQTIEGLLHLNKTVIIIGQVVAALAFPRDVCPTVESNSTARAIDCARKFSWHDPLIQVKLSCNALLQSIAVRYARVLYYDLNEYICPNGICSAYTTFCSSHGECTRVSLYFEHTHLNFYGSKLLGDRIVRNDGVPWQFMIASQKDEEGVKFATRKLLKKL